MRLKEERIIDQWFILIDEASGRGEALLRDTVRLIEERAVPNLEFAYQEVSAGQNNH